MLVFQDIGTNIKKDDVSFAVDPLKKVKNQRAVFVTHAHSDHAKIPKRSDCNYFMSRETAALLGDASDQPFVQTYQQPLEFDDFTVSFHDAGHILGSNQIKFANGSELVVTGDFNLHNDLLFGPAEILEADTLVMEATFGDPSFKFPPREKVYEDMANWVHANLNSGASVILSGYKIGKAQELTKFVTEYLDAVPIVHPKVYEANLIHDGFGFKLGEYLSMSHPEALEVARDPAVFIIPPHQVNLGVVGALAMQFKRRFNTAMATGWSGTRKARGNVSFPLSAHADFDQLKYYVEQSGAKKVYTIHGHPEEMARYLRRETGISAVPLVSKKQGFLTDFCE